MTETGGFVVPQYLLNDWTPIGAKITGVDPSLVRRATLRERIADRLYTIRYNLGHWIAGPCDTDDYDTDWQMPACVCPDCYASIRIPRRGKDARCPACIAALLAERARRRAEQTDPPWPNRETR